MMTTPANGPGDRALDVLATLGVTALTGLSYALSYAALHQLALDKGEPSWAAVLWPACLDVAALVAGLAAIRARRRRRADHYAEALTAAFSLAVIGGNVILAGADPVAVAVHGIPAVTMLACWHLLLRMRAMSSSADAAPDTAEDIDQDTGETVERGDMSEETSASRTPRAPARELVRRLVQRHGQAATPAMVAARTGVSRRHAAWLLADVRRPHIVSGQAAGG
jgi:hypothetical protein